MTLADHAAIETEDSRAPSREAWDEIDSLWQRLQSLRLDYRAVCQQIEDVRRLEARRGELAGEIDNVIAALHAAVRRVP